MSNNDAGCRWSVDDGWGRLNRDEFRPMRDEGWTGRRLLVDDISDNGSSGNAGKNFANRCPFFVPSMSRSGCGGEQCAHQ